jgi:hypothetical protein
MLIVALMPVFAGCFGQFQLTRDIYRFNHRATNSAIMEQLAFWALVIIPVYPIALIVDVVVLNTLDFWSGVDRRASRTITGEDGSEYAFETNGDGKTMTVTITRPNEAPEQLTYTRVNDDQIQVTDAGGALLRTLTR